MEEFLETLIEELKRNDDIISYKEIPFLLSVLTQGFENNKEKYVDFFKDLERYPDYQINIMPNLNCLNGAYDIEVRLAKYYDVEEIYYSEVDSPEYYYLFKFVNDERFESYCQCSPEDEDYREDKQCCGHGCDWVAPEFDLFKVEHIVTQSWCGDQHDYWNFEDEYYKQDKAANEIKENNDRLDEIDRLKTTILEAQKRLAELEINGD